MRLLWSSVKTRKQGVEGHAMNAADRSGGACDSGLVQRKTQLPGLQDGEESAESSMAERTCTNTVAESTDKTLQKNCDADGDICVVKQFLRERKKLDKQKLAEEKKRQKEEAYRRKLLPKDQRVKLVDSNFVDQLVRGGSGVAGSPRGSRDSELQPHPGDFPALEEARGRPRREWSCESRASPAMATGNNDVPAAGAGSDPAGKDTPSKRAHRRDALKINLLDIAKNQCASKQEEDKKKQAKLRKDTKPALCGNPLDSSNPERKRGKVREKKKVKVTSLKKIIRNEVEKRRKKRAELHGADKMSDLDVDKMVLEIVEMMKDLGRPSRDADVTRTQDAVASNETNKENSAADASTAEDRTTKPVVLHSRKFREYCDHFVTADVSTLAGELLRELVRLQDRQHQRDAVKARARRRYVLGLRETSKFLLLRKVKLLLVATDIDNIESSGGLNDLVGELKAVAAAQDLPCVFALQRRKIGYLTVKTRPVSCVAVLNYQACESHVNSLLEAVAIARQQYRDARQNCEVSRRQDEQLESEPEVPMHSDSEKVVKEIIDSFMSLVRSEEPAETSESSSSLLLQAIERTGVS